MGDLHQVVISTIGFLIGMTIMEVIIKPTLVRFGKTVLKKVDDHVEVLPDWLHSEPYDR
jgi:hypothetical protein